MEPLGVVEGINLFSTVFKTRDNEIVIVPSSAVMGGKITNYSAKATRRVDWVFGIGYEDDLRVAKKILVDIISGNEKILKEIASLVAVLELADSSVNFTLRAWVKSEDYWSVYFDTVEDVKLTFDEEGISIPYPQMDIHKK